MRRIRLKLYGMVQGVGFRPFVHTLAHEFGLTGFVQNVSWGLLIEVQGPLQALQKFQERLAYKPPALARIARQESETLDPQDEHSFVIHQSAHTRATATAVSPDITICDECLAEMNNPRDRRFQYPFINCTQCGPRYSIIRAMPYDRPYTSMAVFLMCPQCRMEYENPQNRRFHAQPISCPECGPRLTLCRADGKEIFVTDIFPFLRLRLHEGAVIAVRGIGGFHLCVDAKNDAAVQTLRQRKGRQEKPFALMTADKTVLQNYVYTDATEDELLQSPAHPIVLLRAKPDKGISPHVAPDNRYLAMMLAYTPLHHLLLSGPCDVLVMTSGNLSDEPICIGNDEALDRLGTIADFFLLHDRDILHRCDDSITMVVMDQPCLLRRARGYAPAPIRLARELPQPILACGGEQKNTIALAHGRQVFLSPHIGDLNNPATLTAFTQTIERLKQLTEIEPKILVCDRHPEYLATQWAQQQKNKCVLTAQHHHSHMLSVMAENLYTEPCIGVILDGAGYGDDGTVWGGELLIGDAHAYERFAWLQPTAMPGGDCVVQQPWRMAVSMLYAAFGKEFTALPLPFLHHHSDQELAIIMQMIDKKLNAPLTSSCGRLFDAVAALLDIRQETTFEAQAAMELEMTADENITDCYPLSIPDQGALATGSLIKRLVEDMIKNRERSCISSLFHNTLADLLVRAVCSARQKSDIATVALSGGVFQNRLLFKRLYDRLQQNGFNVLTHKLVPTNDGGLALGQVMIANAQMEKNIDNGRL